MIDRLRLYASTILLLSLSACQHPRPVREMTASEYPYDLPPSLAQTAELLPGGRDICRKLGLDSDIPGRCNSIAVLAASGRQIDRSLWFHKTSTGPMPGTCPHPVDFTRAKAGKGVVTILCGQPDETSTITQAELDRFHRIIQQQNKTQRKTLAQHVSAVELKHEIACQIGTAVSECD